MLNNETKILNEVEEIELFNALANGDTTARDTIIMANEGLIHKVCAKYKSVSSIEYDDLVSEGWVALTKATDKFDITKGFRFSSFASNYIEGTIKNYITKNNSSIHYVINDVEQRRKIYNIKTKLAVELGREPTTKEIAEKCGMFSHEVEKLFKSEVTVSSYEGSLSRDSEEDDFSLAGLVADDTNIAEDYTKVELAKLMKRVFKSANLTELEENALIESKVNNHTLDEVAKIVGINGKFQASKVIERALTKLRNCKECALLKDYCN